MKKLLAVLAWFLLVSSGAIAQSTINPTVPAQNAPLNSGPVRSNFASAYADINGILSMHPVATLGACLATPLVGTDCLVTGSPTSYLWYKYMGLTGYALIATFNPTTNPPSITYTLPQKINLNTAQLPAAQTGTALQIGQANGVPTRIELDSFAAVPRFTCVRFDGTASVPTGMQSADELCSLNAFGYSGSAVVGPQAAIRTYAAQNWTTGAYGTYMRLGVTANGSATLTDALGIEQNGGVTIGTTLGTSAGVGTLNISGNYYVNGAVAATTVNGQNCALGGTCTITASAGTITIGVTTVAGGTPGYVLTDAAGSLGASPTTGAGNVVFSASPTFTGTPVLATPTATSIAVGGASIGSNSLAVTGTTQLNSSLIYGGVTLSNGVTGTGNMVLDTSATLNTPTLSGPVLSGTVTGTYTLGGVPSIPGSAINSGTVSGTFMSAVNLAASGNGGVTGVLPIANGGTSQSSASAAIAALMPTPVRAGDIAYWNGTIWTTLAGNNSGTQVLQENSSGAVSWATITGVGTVTSVGLTAGAGITLSGTNPITSSGTITISGSVPTPQGRLTLAASTPVMTVTSCSGSPCINQSTLRYDCSTSGGQVPYFDGTADRLDNITSCEVTDAMVSAASAGQVVGAQVYDVWWVHGGANRICVAMSSASGGGGGWAQDTGGSNTARGTGFSQLDRTTRGYITNKNSIANCFNGSTNYGSISANQATYLGTFYATSNGQTSFGLAQSAPGGSAPCACLFNAYNRVHMAIHETDTSISWTISSTTWRNSHSSSNNSISYVDGLAEVFVDALLIEGTEGANSTAGLVGIAQNWTSGAPPFSAGTFYSTSSSLFVQSTVGGTFSPLIGFNQISAVEAGGNAALTTFGSIGSSNLDLKINVAM